MTVQAEIDRPAALPLASTRIPWLPALVVAPVLTAVVAVVYWPGFSADWVRDDLNLVAFSRLLGTPWSLFVQDHFHVPGAHFRPIGYLTLWLNQVLFGNGYLSYSLAEFALHVGCTLALYRLIRLTVVSRFVAVLCTLVFAIHPAVISAALWSSDRSGHLATLFTLIAVRAAFDYRDRLRWQSLTIVLTTSLAAMLSKELGVVVAIPITGLWLGAALWRRVPMWRRLLGLWTVVMIYFLWRWWVLGTVASNTTGAIPLPQILAQGLGVWLGAISGYVFFWARLGPLERWWLICCGALILGTLSYGTWRARTAAWRRCHGDVLWIGVSLAIFPGLLQAPIAALNLIPLNNEVSAVEVAMQARLYYLAVAGLVLTASVVLALIEEQWTQGATRWILPAVVANCALFLGLVGWHSVDAYRLRSVEIARIPRAAVAALDDYDLPKRRCLIIYLGIRHAPEWDIYASMDSIVKTVSSNLDRVGHCQIYADYPTYYHFLPAGSAEAEGTQPFEFRQVHGEPLLPRRVGNLEIAYLGAPETLVGADFAHALILAYEDGHFRDVTADVVSGRRSINVR